MNTNKNIHHEVEKTLAALDGIKRQKVDPFFETRLQARIDKQSERKSGFVFNLVFRPAMQLAFAVSLVLVNVISLAVFTLNTEPMQVSEQAVESFVVDNSMDNSMELLVDLNE